MDLKQIVRPPASPIPVDHLLGAETVCGVFADLVQRYPDYECLTLLDRHKEERRFTLGGIGARALEIQAVLGAAGLEPGGCAVLILPTDPELIAAYFAVMFAGGTPTLLATPSHRHARPEVYTGLVNTILDNAEARVIYCDAEVAETLGRSQLALRGGTRVLTPAEVGPCSAPPARVEVKGRDIATIQYSSGTTGPPKGIRLCHEAILENLRATREVLEIDARTVSVSWIPLYHDMGLMDGFLLPLLCGCPTILIPTMDFMRDPSIWLWAIHHYRGSMSWAPNFAYTLAANRVPEGDLEGLDLSSWRIAISAAEPVLADTVRDFTARFASRGFEAEAFCPYYGLAECVTAVTGDSPRSRPRVETIDRKEAATRHRAVPTQGEGLPIVGCGTTLPDCRVEIRDESRRPLPERSVGDIWVSAPWLFTDYNRDPEETARVRVDGWLLTGDTGYLADGHLYFFSRAKDLVVIGGEKYAPHDVESAVNAVPGVRGGCAVAFGIRNRGRGTEELAVVAETKESDGEALAAMERAIRHEVMNATGLGVRHLELVAPGGVQKTTSGKLARSAMRQRYEEKWSGE
ncbi:MAG: AMP-binding protein [Deltaproteobacteria bacterium]|nr:AMP-binding protein [Deltaproteobacteria bacterium]